MICATTTTMSKKFILLMPWGRVGSNALCALLNSRSDVRIDNEPLTSVATRLRAKNASDETIAKAQNNWLLNNFFRPIARKGAALCTVPSGLTACEYHGLNVAIDSLYDVDYLLMCARAQCTPIVALRRRNTLAVAVSVAQAERSGSYANRNPTPIDADIGALIDKARYAQQADQLLQQALEQYDCVEWIDYEDWSDAKQVADQIYRFVTNGDPIDRVNWSQREQSSVQHRLTNVDAVNTALEGTEFAKMLFL